MPDKPSNGRAEFAFPPVMMPFGFEAFMDLQRPALAAMAQMNGKVYDSLSTMNRNWASFLNRRLKEDLAMPQQLAECKTVQDLYGVYTEFFQTAMSDYKAEFEQMSRLGKAMAETTVKAVQTSAEEVARTATEKVRSKAA